jgi:hypothetical protein
VFICIFSWRRYEEIPPFLGPLIEVVSHPASESDTLVWGNIKLLPSVVSICELLEEMFKNALIISPPHFS